MTAAAHKAEPATAAGAITSLSRLRRWTRPHRAAIITMIFAASGAMIAQSVIPIVIGRVVDGPIRHGEASGLWELAGLALLLGLLEAGLLCLRRFAMVGAALGVETDIRRDLYAHTQRLHVAFHDRWPSGQLLSRLTNDLSTVQRFVGFAFVFLIANTVAILTVFALMIVTQVWLGLAVIAAMAPLVVFTRRFELRYAREARYAQDLTGDLTTSVEESVLGIRVIKSYGRRRHMLCAFSAEADGLREAELTKLRTLGRFWAMLEGHPQFVLAGVALGGVLAVVHGAMTVGALVAFLTLYLRLIWPMISLGWLLALTQEAASASRRIFEVLDTAPSIADPPGARGRPRQPHAGHRVPAAPREAAASGRPPARGAALRFDGVRFRYADADTDVLRGVDLEVAAGETMALVGAVGCGKTTLTALVGRLYDVTGGALVLDHRDVRELSLDELRTQVGTAFEEATLFSASVRENLTLGRPGIGEDDVLEVLEVAQAGFVHELPFGLDTRIGEQGLSLSGGQRQRLALARALLGRPRVLVLDDPLSALDVHTEALVEDALRRVLAETTVLLVAHRPSTVLLADRVALLESGRIAAVGTHSELLATVPAYRDLLAQTSELERT